MDARALLSDCLMACGDVARCALIARGPCERPLLSSCPPGWPPPADLRALTVAFSSAARRQRQHAHRVASTELPTGWYRRGVTLRIDGRTYAVIRADAWGIYATGISGGETLVAVRTHGHVLVAIADKSMCPGVCIEACEKLGDYLRLKGK